MDILDQAFRDSKIVDMRLRYIMRQKPTCPKCGTDQLQIMNRASLIDRAKPAYFRCRMCKHWFEFCGYITQPESK